MAAVSPDAHASSTGQVMTGATWLDVHFEADRPEYEAHVRAVGVHPGWRVLDVGCGAGNFRPMPPQRPAPLARQAAAGDASVIPPRIARCAPRRRIFVTPSATGATRFRVPG
jgi:hypothetical protein